MEATPTEQLTIDDYVRLYDLEGPFEIINGERIKRMPPVAIHTYMIRALFRILDAYCQKNGLGEVFAEMAFVLSYSSNWVSGSRIPDLMFIAADRWQAYTSADPNWKQKPLVIVPDVAVEVVSQNDLYTDVQNKVEIYQQDGVRVVWVVDPMRKRVEVVTGDSRVTLTEADILSGGEVLPGLAVPVSDIFNETSS